MLQRILVATDFSPAAHRAVLRAGVIARQSGAELTVLHVLPERGLLERVLHRHEIDRTQMAAGAERALQRETDALRAASAIAAKPAILEGIAHRAIEATGAALRADLVVIGARGESEVTLGTRMLGGTAFKCLTTMTLPLLLVRSAIAGRYYKVLAAVDGSDSAHDVLAWALEMSKGGAICEALHAFDTPFAARLRAHGVEDATIEAYATEERERARNELVALAARLAATERVTPLVTRGNAVPTILHEIVEREADLVVLGRHARREHLADRSILGSVSLRVALDAPVDVLLTA